MKPVPFFTCFVGLTLTIISVVIAGVPQVISAAALIVEINQENLYHVEPIDSFDDEVAYYNDTTQISEGDVHTYDSQTSVLVVGSISYLLRNWSEVDGVLISDTGVGHWQAASADEGRYYTISKINDKFSTTLYSAQSLVSGNSEAHSSPKNLFSVVPSST